MWKVSDIKYQLKKLDSGRFQREFCYPYNEARESFNFWCISCSSQLRIKYFCSPAEEQRRWRRSDRWFQHFTSLSQVLKQKSFKQCVYFTQKVLHIFTEMKELIYKFFILSNISLMLFVEENEKVLNFHPGKVACVNSKHKNIDLCKSSNEKGRKKGKTCKIYY